MISNSAKNPLENILTFAVSIVKDLKHRQSATVLKWAQVPKCRTHICSHSGVVSWAFQGTMAKLLKKMGKLQCWVMLLSNIQLH